MSGLTSGPWTAVPWSSVVGSGITAQPDPTKNTLLIARVMSSYDDALAMAAGPDLLRAATAATHALRSLLAMRDGITDEALQGVVEALDAAIAKAKGESPTKTE